MSKYIFLIVGCSGSGKTTITEQLEQKYGLKSIQSYTTRPKRSENEAGHIFVTDAEFDKLTDMVAYTKFDNNQYCAITEQVENNDLYVIDPKGIEYFREHYHGNKGIKIIYIDSSLSTRYERMKKRAEENGNSYTESVNTSLGRVNNDINEFYDYFHGNAPVDFTVTNNDDDKLEDVVDKVYQYICSCESEVM